MTVNRTTLLDLPLPVTGTESGTWGDTTNNGLTQYMDIAIAGMSNLTSANFTAGAVTIETTEGTSSATNIVATSAQYAGFRVTSLAQNSTITVGNTGTSPARSYRLINADATYSLTFKATGQTGVTLLPGQSAVVAFNGTDYVIVGMVGAGTATDNAVVRFDGTTGKLVQNSVVTIADSTGDVAGVGALTMGGNLTLSGGTANGVLYLNGSKVATSGSALVFDGTNLGLGVTPSAANLGKALQITNASFVGYSNNAYVGANWYYGSSDKYIANGFASLYAQDSSVHKWYTAPSGTAGNAISFTQALTLDASGNLGLGATSITAISSGYATAHIGGANGGGVKLGTSSTSHGYLAGSATNIELGATSNIFLSFFTNNAERARITSGGDLLVGTTSDSFDTAGARMSSSGSLNCTRNTSFYVFYCYNLQSSSGYYVEFKGGGTVTGNITYSGSTTSYNTSSDYRLKENIQPITGALKKLAALKPCTYKWKADGSDGEGFIAHELAEVAPQCVTGEKDAVDENGNPKYQGIDTSFLVATLTAAIQEQQALITSLTARVALLEGN